jgi:hypothetical protein
MKHTIKWSKEIEYFNCLILVELEVTGDIDRGGIGPYEFWGAKCYDEGGLVAEIHDWKVLSYKVIYGEDDSVKEIKDTSKIGEFIEKHIVWKYEEEINEALIEYYNDGEPDYYYDKDDY